LDRVSSGNTASPEPAASSRGQTTSQIPQGTGSGVEARPSEPWWERGSWSQVSAKSRLVVASEHVNLERDLAFRTRARPRPRARRWERAGRFTRFTASPQIAMRLMVNCSDPWLNLGFRGSPRVRGSLDTSGTSAARLPGGWRKQNGRSGGGSMPALPAPQVGSSRLQSGHSPDSTLNRKSHILIEL
jgi:hypothetical protein